MISKSSYVKYTKCSKYLWLYINKREAEAKLSEFEKGIISDGNMVGELARSYFDGTVSASKVDENGAPIYSEQVQLTKKALSENANCIAEASFMCDDLFCAVDLLKKDNDEYSIYEVKSSLDIDASKLADIAFQRYVLEKCGLKINHIYILHPNREYVLHKKLDLKEYFIAECVDDNETVLENVKNIDESIDEIRKILKNREPKTVFNNYCIDCSFKKYCLKAMPEDNVSVLNGPCFYRCFNKGIITVEDFSKSQSYKNSTNAMLKLQVESILNKSTTPYINKEKLKEFLDGIRYPLYHLDFETTDFVIPMVDGFRPKESYPFQYSLHIEQENGQVKHKEFLGEQIDPTRALAEKLVRDIPENSQLIAFNISTEKKYIKYLAEKYPDLSDRLLNMANNFLDLIDVFKKGYYYDPKQGSSNSIKEAMPALCPHMAEAYHNLSVVHNGGEAKTEYARLMEVKDKDKDEYERIRTGMLEYCKLDTLSMVEILKVLKSAI